MKNLIVALTLVSGLTFAASPVDRAVALSGGSGTFTQAQQFVTAQLLGVDFNCVGNGTNQVTATVKLVRTGTTANTGASFTVTNTVGTATVDGNFGSMTNATLSTGISPFIQRGYEVRITGAGTNTGTAVLKLMSLP